MNRGFYYYQKLIIVFTSVVALSGCALMDIVVEPDTPEKSIISEPSINTIAIEPVSTPSTKLPSATLEQARQSYITLMESTDSTDLIAESLQRLAEIESMIAENKLVDDQPIEMRQHLNLAAQYYQQLLTNYPSKIDQSKIQYQLAHVLELEGSTEKAHSLLSQLAQLKGADFEVVEAGFRLAENAFSRKKYTDALKLYSKVLSHKNEPSNGQVNSFYNTALFKRGWTHFKKQNYDYSVIDFMELLQLIYQNPDKRSNSVNSLIIETYRITALSLSYMNGPASLAETIQKHGHKEFEAELYLTLAEQYIEQQRFQDTAETYFTFVRENPNNSEAPKFDNKGIDILAKSGFIDLVLTAKENFVKRYENGADYWQQSQLTRSEKVSTMLYKNLTDVIDFHHAQAQQTKQTKDYLTAANWYRVFLNSFAQHDDANDKQWLLAEALNDAGEILESIKEYQILAYQDNNLIVSRKEEAGFRVLLGKQHLFLALESTHLEGKHLEGKPINDSENLKLARNQLIDAGLIYSNTFVGVKRVPEVLAQTIELQLANGQTLEAVSLARTIKTTQWSSKAQLKRSREIIANGEFDLQHYALAENAYTAILTEDKYPSAKMKKFHQRRAQAVYKQAEAFKINNDFENAIEHFLRLGQLEPDAIESISAQYDAASLLLETKSYKRAIRVLDDFAFRFPKHSLTSSIPAKLILAYEALEDWSGAAKQYQQVANNTQDSEIVKTAIWQAATHWMKINNEESLSTSVMLWKKYIKLYPDPVDLSLEARNNLVNLYGTLDIKWKQDFWRRKIINTVSTFKLDDLRARTLAAESQLSLTNDSFHQFKAINLSQPLRISLKNKRKQLDASLKGYSKLLDYKIQSISTQAGFRIGELYAILATSILNSERPKGMNELELEEYETLLEEKVYPFEDQAIEAFESNVSLSKQGIWDEWIINSFQQLELLLPARYKKPEVIDDYAKTP